MTAIRFQDPEAGDPAYLLEELIDVVRRATSGWGLFAFASRDGVRTLLGKPDFEAFLGRGPFDLVVGLDAITNVAALEELHAIAAAFPGLTARAFLHTRATIFHPKLCFFDTPDGGVAFVGSGNLTPGGLAGNWEAYARIHPDPTEAASLLAAWTDWKTRHDAQLLELTDERARARAALNVRRPRVWIPVAAAPSAAPAPAPAAPTAEAADVAVLLAEIPRGSTRWNQANFDKASFTAFFGADPSVSHKLLLWRLKPNGSVEGVETRPTVAVRSHNYRVELEAAAGLTYPAGALVPIGAFLRMSVRQFRYILLMPGDPGYDRAEALLTEGAGAPHRPSMRRHVFTPAEVSLAWPNSPLLAADAEESDAEEAAEAIGEALGSTDE